LQASDGKWLDNQRIGQQGYADCCKEQLDEQGAGWRCNTWSNEKYRGSHLVFRFSQLVAFVQDHYGLPRQSATVPADGKPVTGNGSTHSVHY
jgi:hypothetical protein